MNDPQSSETAGKISQHDDGLGVPSPRDAEARARELAVIAGRAASDFNQTDLAQAKAELLGQAVPAADSDEMVASVTQWDEAPGSSGHHTKNHGPADEVSIGQELVEEGVQEALHDEMVEARKKID